MYRTLLLLLTLLAAMPAFSAQIDEARQLQKEAQDILRASSGAVADPKVYAEAVRKLEKAQSLLDDASKAGSGNEQLEQEISSSLFWARRFANVNVIKELGKGDSGTGTPAPPKPPEEPAKGPDLAKAEAEYRKAEEYENSHKSDDYAIALRWFQFAADYTGTDWAVRGLGRAREAQARFQAKTAKSNPNLSEDEKKLAEGDELFNDKKFEEALVKFEEAKKLKDTILASRRIGHVHVELGHKCRDEYAAQYLPVLKRYNEAVRRGDKAGAAALTRQAQALVNSLKPLEQKALKEYDLAQAAFQHGLDIGKGSDLECEAQIAILYFDRGRDSRPQCRTRLASMLTKYQPANDQERTVYEFSRSLFKSLGGAVR